MYKDDRVNSRTPVPTRGYRTAIAASLAALAALTGTAALASGAVAEGAVVASGPLQDLDVLPGPFDGASARVVSAPAGPGQTVVVLQVSGADASGAGQTFGAHVHVGPCVAGNGAAALGHYLHAGAPSPTTEVWLDVTLTPEGTATSVARVPFDITPGGARSVVLHALPTAATGVAGPRLACLSVDF